MRFVYPRPFPAALAFLFLGLWVDAAEPVPLGSLDLTRMQQGGGKPRANLSVEGRPLTIGGQLYQSGLGTHADSALLISRKGGALSLYDCGERPMTVAAEGLPPELTLAEQTGSVKWSDPGVHGRQIFVRLTSE